MHLALVIPALNEQEAIASTLRRALAARAKVIEQTAVDRMTIVFVNDGSTDRTQQIVDGSEFDDVVKVRFEQNQGYGQAIKTGYRETDADLVGFMDADGTCDPDFCVKLVNRLLEKDADVVLATRLTPESEMPRIRRIGNIIFARLLGVVSGQHLTDAASGFRILRRSSLKLMTPLPDGLHYTPAMSAICLLDHRLGIEEVPMPYKERIGRSKLSVVMDGFRFLLTILFAACCYAPLKTMFGCSVIGAVVFVLLGWTATATGGPVGVFSVAVAAGLFVSVLMGTGVVVHQLNFLLIGPRSEVGPLERSFQFVIHSRRLIGAGAVVAAAGALMLATAVLTILPPDLVDGVTLGMTATLITVIGVGIGAVGVIIRVIWAVGRKQKAMIEDDQETAPIAANDPRGAASLEVGDGSLPTDAALGARQ